MRTAEILVIAHRGARAYAPENTIAAIEKAARAGADAVEIDVRLSGDGEPLVCHDADLVRCTDVRERYPRRSPWLLAAFDAAEVQALDAGGWFVDELRRPPRRRARYLRSLTGKEASRWISPDEMAHYASGAVRVPHLRDCLDACARLRLPVHLELKNGEPHGAQLVDGVLRALAETRMEDDALVSSFDHGLLAAVHDRAPRLRTAALSEQRLPRPAEYLARLGAYAYCPAAALLRFHGAHNTGRHAIREITDAGYRVYAWTANDTGRMRQLIEAGVSGIYTDYPDRLCAVLDAGHDGNDGPHSAA